MLSIEHQVIPNDYEAEQAVLGAIIYDNNYMIEALASLSPVDFYTTAHQHIFRSMVEVESLGKPIDELILGDSLKSLNQLEEVGGYGYMATLEDCVPSSGNIKHYCEIIKNHSLLRKLISVTTDIARKSRDPECDITELLTEADAKISELGSCRNVKSYRTIKEIVKERIIKYDEIYNSTESRVYRTTGFTDLDKRLSGLRPKKMMVIAGRPSMGKGLKLSENVLMSDGTFKKNGDLKIGDSLASVDGGPNFVTGIYDKNIIPFYRVTFKDGRHVDCDKDHLWSVSSCRLNYEEKVFNVEKLKEVIEKQRYKGRVYTTPISGNFGKKSDIGIDPWLLGVLLGDGCLTRSCLLFSNTEKYIIDRVASSFSGIIKKTDNDNKRCDYRMSNGGGLTSEYNFIVDSGLKGKKSSGKFVPKIIFKSDKNIREQVLAGLLETDGWVEKKHALMFSSASEQLRDDVARLVQSLGGNASKTKKDDVFYSYKNENKRGLPAYKLCINLSEHHFIKSPRLLARFLQRAIPHPKIKSIKKIEPDFSRCISVSHRSKLYCVNDYIMTHNTALAVNIAERSDLINKHTGAIVIFSYEMSDSEVGDRAITTRAKVDYNDIINKKPYNMENVYDSAGTLSDMNMYVFDKMVPIEQMRNELKNIARLHEDGISLVISDYMQLIPVLEKLPREQQISKISRTMKMIAMEMDCVVIPLSQLNRKVDERSNKRPLMSDLRESGAIEQDADIILFVYRDEYYNPETEDKGIAEIIISKNRGGPVGTERLKFDEYTTRFDNLSRDYQ